MAGTTTALAQDFGDYARSLNLDSETQTNAWALVEKLYSLPLQQVVRLEVLSTHHYQVWY